MMAILEMKLCPFCVVAWLGLLSICCRTLQEAKNQKLSLEGRRRYRKEKGRSTQAVWRKP